MSYSRSKCCHPPSGMFLLFSLFSMPFLLLLLSLIFACPASALLCYNSCSTSTASPSPYIHNITRNATKSCQNSCTGNSCYTMYSAHFNVPAHGCSTRNLTYPGCIADNGTEVLCYCRSTNCNMPFTLLIKDGWSFPEIVLTLPLSTFLNSTVAMASTASSSSSSAYSSINGNITIREMQDGVNLDELISPLLHPDPSSLSNSSQNVPSFPLVMVKPPEPLYYDEGQGKGGTGTGGQQKEDGQTDQIILDDG